MDLLVKNRQILWNGDNYINNKIGVYLSTYNLFPSPPRLNQTRNINSPSPASNSQTIKPKLTLHSPPVTSVELEPNISLINWPQGERSLRFIYYEIFVVLLENNWNCLIKSMELIVYIISILHFLLFTSTIFLQLYKSRWSYSLWVKLKWFSILPLSFSSSCVSKYWI